MPAGLEVGVQLPGATAVSAADGFRITVRGHSQDAVIGRPVIFGNKAQCPGHRSQARLQARQGNVRFAASLHQQGRGVAVVLLSNLEGAALMPLAQRLADLFLG